MASRMMSTGLVGKVHLSGAAARAIEALSSTPSPEAIAAADASIRDIPPHRPLVHSVERSMIPLPIAPTHEPPNRPSLSSGNLPDLPAVSHAEIDILRSFTSSSRAAPLSGSNTSKVPGSHSDRSVPIFRDAAETSRLSGAIDAENRRPALPFTVQLRGSTFVKGKGSMDTFWLVSRENARSLPPIDRNVVGAPRVPSLPILQALNPSLRRFDISAEDSHNSNSDRRAHSEGRTDSSGGVPDAVKVLRRPPTTLSILPHPSSWQSHTRVRTSSPY